MADVEPQGAQRGLSSSHMRAFACKDCRREIEALQREINRLKSSGSDPSQLKKLRSDLKMREERATYNENWARGLIERGGSRSDRCKDHRQKHRSNIQGMAVAYIDLETVGEVLDRENPTGPLGGLGPLPDTHEVVPNTSFDLQKVNVGMTDEDAVKMVRLLRDKQVLILKAGTGTGKSTFVPYRLMDPPPETLEVVPRNAPFAKLTELGPIIVTEPRVQATIGVASFVGGVMSGVGKEVERNGEKIIVGGVGPGCPVGYQVSGDRNHDDACELIYVTDGTMINWLREGRLSKIGTVIIDEAHERSTNIDFIMGYLKRELPRYRHLRVIVTSATFNTAFYLEYFGGPDVANVMEVPAVKSFGYGMPLFPELDAVPEDEREVLDLWTDPMLPLSENGPRRPTDFVRTHWPEQYGPPFEGADVLDEEDIGEREDIWETTQKLLDMRYQEASKIPVDQWKDRMPDEVTKFVIQLARGLDKAKVFGDILAFLPTTRTITLSCEQIEQALGGRYKGHVFPLISTLDKDRQKRALAKRRKGDPRKIVISTNLAETSLTVEGVRFVVDTGIIAQSEWDPDLADGGVPTKPHSQAGIKQRWGRVGRKAPGWVFPLYTKGQYLALAEDTPPGSTRENLEALVMTAKMGGIDEVVNFPWPAAFEPTTTELDQSAIDARRIFRRELVRADTALRAGGAIDHDGHPTSFGKELARLQGLESTASALAILYADRLACVPEVVTVLALLEGKRLIGKRALLQDDFEWPDEWRLEAAERHRALANVCEDDAHLALLITAAWERADERVPPWEYSEPRQKWARRWWVNNQCLLEAAEKRQEILASLSPSMKEEVKRFIEPALLDRARAVITRAFAAQSYRAAGADVWESVAERVVLHDDQAVEHSEEPSFVEAPQSRERIVADLEDDQLTRPSTAVVVALRRREARGGNRISSVVSVQEWAIPIDGADQPTGVRDAMRIVMLAAREAPPNPEQELPLHLMRSWPIGQRVRLHWVDGTPQIDDSKEIIPPFVRPKIADELDESRRKRRRTRRRSSFDLDEPEATREDTAGDFGTVGPQDDREEEMAAVAAAERQQVADLACGSCFPCLDGRVEDCEDPSAGHDIRSKVTDPLQSWRAQARNGIDVSTPRILVEGPSAASDGWYEVTGYGVESARPEVRVRPDWRPEGFRGNPAQHLGVAPGQPIVVTVGPLTRHHGGPVRAFVRTDGGGRFLVREASSYKGKVQEERSEIALSLDRGTTGLLEDLVEDEVLTATVVPARIEGCYTITLLELFYQHWEKAGPGRGYENHVLDPTRRNAKREKVYNAEIESPPNEFGFVTATLRHQDVARGIKHRFSFNVLLRDSGDAAVSPTETAVNMVYPASVFLHLARDYAQLDVGDLDLDQLEAIEKSEVGGLKLIDARDSDDQEEEEADEGKEEPVRYAAPGAILRSVSNKPVSRKAVATLAALDETGSWQNEVWAFWARSHHLQIDRRSPFLPGKATEVFDVRSEVDLSSEDETNAERLRRMVIEYRRDHPENTVVEAEVERITDGAVFVKLRDGLEGRVPVSELSWAFTEHASDEVHPGKMLRLLVTEAIEDPPRVTLSVRALLPKPYDEFKGRHKVGDTVEAEVDRVSKSHVNVRHSNGAPGVVHVSNLRWERVEDATALYKPGDTVKAVILKFDNDKEQIELSVKAQLPKPYPAFKESHKLGSVVEAQVTGMNKSFAYLSLPGGAEGSIHVSKLAPYRILDPSTIVTAGQSLRAVIVGWDDERSRVELSLIGVPVPATPERPTPTRSAASSGAPSAAPPPRMPPPAPPKPKRTARGEGRTVDEAKSLAAASLGLSPARVRSRVIQQPKVGMFGKLKRAAIVEVTEG